MFTNTTQGLFLAVFRQKCKEVTDLSEKNREKKDIFPTKFHKKSHFVGIHSKQA